MDYREAFKILSEYGLDCDQKIKKIEREVKIHALVCYFDCLAITLLITSS